MKEIIRFLLWVSIAIFSQCLLEAMAIESQILHHTVLLKRILEKGLSEKATKNMSHPYDIEVLPIEEKYCSDDSVVGYYLHEIDVMLHDLLVSCDEEKKNGINVKTIMDLCKAHTSWKSDEMVRKSLLHEFALYFGVHESTFERLYQHIENLSFHLTAQSKQELKQQRAKLIQDRELARTNVVLYAKAYDAIKKSYLQSLQSMMRPKKPFIHINKEKFFTKVQSERKKFSNTHSTLYKEGCDEIYSLCQRLCSTFENKANTAEIEFQICAEIIDEQSALLVERLRAFVETLPLCDKGIGRFLIGDTPYTSISLNVTEDISERGKAISLTVQKNVAQCSEMISNAFVFYEECINKFVADLVIKMNSLQTDMLEDIICSMEQIERSLQCMVDSSLSSLCQQQSNSIEALINQRTFILSQCSELSAVVQALQSTVISTIVAATSYYITNMQNLAEFYTFEYINIMAQINVTTSLAQFTFDIIVELGASVAQVVMINTELLILAIATLGIA